MGKVETPIDKVSASDPADSIELDAVDGAFVAFNVGRKVWGEVEVLTQMVDGKPGEPPGRRLVVRIEVLPGITSVSDVGKQGQPRAYVDVTMSEKTKGPFPKDLL
jgi:hypothetical protein